VASGCACANFRFTIQLENGQTATDFEPYTGGQPSPSPSYPQNIYTVTGRQTVTATGKNIWDSDFVIGGIGSDGLNLYRADRFNSASFISVEPNTQYTFSATPKTAGKTAQVFFLAYDSRQSYIKQLPSNAWYDLPLAITTGQDTRYLKISGRYSDNTAFGTVGNATDAIQNVQLEKGNQATTFEPYHGQNYEINLGKNLLDASELSQSAIDEGIRVDDDGVVSDSTPTADGRGWTFDQLNWHLTLPSGTYTATIRMTTPCTSQYGSFRGYTQSGVALWTASNNLQNVSNLSFTFTLSSQTNIGISAKVFNGAGTVQLEKGSTASSYCAYFEPIELCKIGTHQDRIYKENGKW
jgi:hypothetical protein